MTKTVNPNWPQQQFLIEDLEAFATREGLRTSRGALDFPALGTRFSLSGATIKQYAQNFARSKPGTDTLIGMASIMGTRFERYIDSAEAPKFIKQDDWDDASEKKRVLASAMFSEMTCMTDEEAEQLYQLWKHAQGIGRARLEAEQKANEGK